MKTVGLVFKKKSGNRRTAEPEKEPPKNINETPVNTEAQETPAKEG